MLWVRGLVTAVGAGSWPAVAHACTVCNSHAGMEVRAGIFDGHFVRTLVLVALPFPVLGLAVGMLHFGMPELGAAEPELGEVRGETPIRGVQVEMGDSRVGA